MHYLVLVACVVICAASIRFYSIAKNSVADGRIRKYWAVLSIFSVVYSLSIFSVYVLLPAQVTELVSYIVPLVFGFILYSVSWLTSKTVEYFKDINSINGICITDSASGVYNKIYLEQRLGSEVARCHRYGSPLSLLSVSLVGYSLLQEEYGHQAAGIAASKVAIKLKALLRETDVVTTTGQGRFILILPDTPEGSVDHLIIRLYSALEGMQIIDGAGKEQSLSINVKFGKSHCGLQTNAIEELIAEAIENETTNQPVAAQMMAG